MIATLSYGLMDMMKITRWVDGYDENKLWNICYQRNLREEHRPGLVFPLKTLQICTSDKSWKDTNEFRLYYKWLFTVAELATITTKLLAVALAVLWATSRLSSGGNYSTTNPSQILLKLKSWSSITAIFVTRVIVISCTEQSSITVVLCAKYQNDSTIDIAAISK